MEAKRFDPATLEDIRARVRLIDLVARDGVRLVRRGREWWGCCPFHAEKSPSFSVSEAKGFYHCFGCGAHGDVFGYLTARGRSFVESVAELADLAGVEVQGRRPSRPLAPIVPRQTAAQAAEEEERIRLTARSIWARSRPGRGTVVEAYLRQGRGLDLDAIGGVPAALRLLPDHPLLDGDRRVIHSGPAMVAPLVTADRQIVGIHRTWLLPDGSGRLKTVDGQPVRGKKMLGQHMGAVIPLAARAERMQAGEGIETALSGWCAVPGLPAVAFGSLGNLTGRSDDASAGVQPWAGLQELVWLFDADGKDPEETARLVERGLRRFAAAGVVARRADPPQGHDFNDLYRREG